MNAKALVEAISKEELLSVLSDPTDNLVSRGFSRIYRRETIGGLEQPPVSASERHSRKIAKSVFQYNPKVDLVEYVSSGRKTDSQIVTRNATRAPKGCFVYVASTGGSWGKSSKMYPPVDV